MDEQRRTDQGRDRETRPEDVTDALRAAVERTLSATAGSATGTRRRAQELLDEVTRRGGAARQQVSRRGDEARQELARRRAEAREALAERIASLERRLGELETSVRGEERPPPQGGTPESKPQVDVEPTPKGEEAEDG